MDRETACHVCGDKASGKHYGVPSCDGCRGFFKRSIRRNLEYTCKETGDCLIDVTRRNQCQACRFAKCLRVRMKRDAVQHERAPRCNTTTCSNELALLSSTAGGRFGATTLTSSINASFIRFQPSFPTRISGLKFQSNSFVPDSENSTDNLSLGNDNEVSSSEEIERKCNGKNTTYLPFSINCILSDDINECASKLLVLTVEWIKSIPSFLQLTERDKSVLLNETWNELFILNAIEWSFSFYDNLLTCPKQKHSQNSKKLTDIQRKLKLVTDRFHSLQVDHTEFACLKALTLFKSDAQNLQNRLHIEILQDQTQLMLQNYSAIRQNLRFGRLLLLLKSIGTFESRTIEELFFNKYPADNNVSICNFILDLLRQ